MSDAPVIEGFEYIEPIGSGGFADVHLYRQRMPRRAVAVKILRSGELSGAVKRQFIVEANVMARLSNHPGIATIFTAGISSDDRPYLVMEYCPGGSLAQRYRANPFDIAEAVSIGVRMAAALESAHRVGVVHRDVKPANILISEYGSPVLTDFGIALGHDDSLESTMLQNMSTQQSTRDASGLAYSVPWSAPEVLLELDQNDAIADVYSLAATVRTLIEGRSPFEQQGGNNSFLALSRRIEQGAATPWERVDVPEKLKQVIERAMAPDRAMRHLSALEFAEELRDVERAEGFSVSNIDLLSSETSNDDTVRSTRETVVAASPVESDEADHTVIVARDSEVNAQQTGLSKEDVPPELDATLLQDTVRWSPRGEQQQRSEALRATQEVLPVRLVTPDIDADAASHGELAATGVEDPGPAVGEGVAASEKTQLRMTVDRADSSPTFSRTRRPRRRQAVMGAVALASAIAVAAIAIPTMLGANPTGTARCENLSDKDNESAVPLTLTQERLNQIVPDDLEVLCGFSMPWEGEEYPATTGQYHVLVLEGSGTDFEEVARAISALSQSLECDRTRGQAFGTGVREEWRCTRSIEGEWNFANVYELGKAPPSNFSFVPAGVSSSIVIALRLSDDFSGWS